MQPIVGSSPTITTKFWPVSSGGEHRLDKARVDGSKPSLATKLNTAMDNYNLIIGDNGFGLSEYASAMFVKNSLVTNENYDQVDKFSVDCLYTSLADIDDDKLLKLCLDARDIHYWPPTYWSNNDLGASTKRFLTKIVKYHKLVVRNFVIDEDPTNSLVLLDQRKSNSEQLWITGCSYAYGFGLKDSQDRYIETVAKTLKKPLSDLAGPGTSIGWAADQLLRSDIQKGDVVIWGITGIHRVDYYIDNRQVIMPNLGGKLSSSERKFFDRLITDDNRLNQSIKSVYQVSNFIKKVGARLVLVFHSDLSLHEHSKLFDQYLWGIDGYLPISSKQDITDDGHPGPITNNIWAMEILDFLKN